VNFLVGENSTGKTSILGVLQLMSLPNFWLGSSFGLEPGSFGNFRDAVSANSADSSYFRIGIIGTERSDDDNKKKSITGVLMTFVEREGVPALARYVRNFDDQVMEGLFGPKTVRYRLGSCQRASNEEAFLKDTFLGWLSQDLADTSGFKNAATRGTDLSRLPPIVALSFIEETKVAKIKKRGHALPLPFFVTDLTWLAPIRSKPKKTYDEFRLEFSPEGEHIPYVIRKRLSSKADAETFERFLRKIGKSSGLFESVRIKRYGKGATAPFELDVVLNRLPLSISNVGYGVSQALPVIVELFTRREGASIAVQQPEVHLHPKAQAALGEMIFELAHGEEKKFFIETHSDYLIDRYRLSCRKESKNMKPDSQVLFFERSAGWNRVHSLPIDGNGDLPGDQPKGYREFFVKEEMDLLGI